MIAELTYKCESCAKEIEQPGLCDKCLKRHDRRLKFIIGIVWILTAICLGYYYIFFIAS